MANLGIVTLISLVILVFIKICSINKKVMKILFVIILFVLIAIVWFFFSNNIKFFIDSLKYHKYYSYDYSNDIEKNGHITEEGAVKIAMEKSESNRIANLETHLDENGESKVWTVLFVKKWTFGLKEVIEVEIDYYTGEVITIIEEA